MPDKNKSPVDKRGFYFCNKIIQKFYMSQIATLSHCQIILSNILFYICVPFGILFALSKLKIKIMRLYYSYIKEILQKFIKHLVNTNGNSLMEFAVTTAMMAILAATAAPKLSILSENAKMAKSKDELDKLAAQALNFFQEAAAVEGRGRFPGQEKYNSSVTGSALSNSSIQEHRNAILEDLITNGGTFRSFNNTNDGADWVSVFGKNNEDFPKPTTANLASDDGGNFIGKNEWMGLFGNEPLGSPFQDGHYVYQVVAGTGSGSKAESPILYIADLENPSQIYAVIQP